MTPNDAPVVVADAVASETASACGAPAQTRCAGGCFDLRDDPAHCGACETSCPATAPGSAGASRCVAGRCVLVCASGRADCDGRSENGCETALASSAASCGRCGLACAPAPSAAVSCVDAECALACEPARGDCDQYYDDGCEAATDRDPEHCGACDARCPWPARTELACRGGGCTHACRAGYADCDRVAANGCEVSLTSARNCGACGAACGGTDRYCAEAAGGARCVAVCPAGTTDCDFSCVHVERDPDHCGACGVRCPGALNAQAACVPTATGEGRCALECRPGYADCDRAASTGCESALATDRRNCGACGLACAAGRRCILGVCRESSVAEPDAGGSDVGVVDAADAVVDVSSDAIVSADAAMDAAMDAAVDVLLDVSADAVVGTDVIYDAAPRDARPLVPCATEAGGVCPTYERPTGPCPLACTGGCDGDVCVITCDTAAACGRMVVCPTDRPCRLRCRATSSCQALTLRCPPFAPCEVHCDGLSSCQVSTIECGAGPCGASCEGTSTSVRTVGCAGSCQCGSTCRGC